MTSRQMAALRYIAGFQEAHGYSPAMEDVAEGIGLSRGSKAPAHKVLTELEQAGHIRRLRQRARAIDLLTVPAIPRGPDGEPMFFVAVQHGEA